MMSTFQDPFLAPFHGMDSLMSRPNVSNVRRGIFGTDGPLSINSEIIDTDNEFVVILELPGVPKDKIDVTIESNTLTVKYVKEKIPVASELSIVSSDFAYGNYIRRFKLPLSVNQDSATTSFKDGMLCIKFVKPVSSGVAKKLLIQG